MENNLTNIDFWDNGYKTQENFFIEKLEYSVTKKIYKYFSGIEFKNKKVFEIGCYPGRFLWHFGKLGFNLNGIDQISYLDKMVNWFKENKFNIGEFFVGDIFDFRNEQKYDVVFSSGFIEHFRNFEEVIKIHTELVSDGGYIYITTPNFAGCIQKTLHSIFDKQNLKAHYLPSMNPKIWKKVLETKGFEVLDYGYMGGFNFWSANKNIISRIFVKVIRTLFCWNFLPNTRAYSPDIFILAKKK